MSSRVAVAASSKGWLATIQKGTLLMESHVFHLSLSVGYQGALCTFLYVCHCPQCQIFGCYLNSNTDDFTTYINQQPYFP